MKFWYLTAVLAVVCAGYVVRDLVQNPGDPLSPDGFGGLVGFLAMAVVTTFLFRRSARNTRIDDSGPVAPAEDPAVGEGTRWTLDQIAAVVALQVQPMNGLVFADERTGTLRVMIDPPSAITWSAGERDLTPGFGTDERREHRDSAPYFTGQWTRVRMHPGRLPEVANQSSTLSVAYNDAGTLVPQWSAATGDSLQADPSVLTAAGSRTPISFEFDSRELQHAVDRIAVRAGWVSEQQVSARPTDPETRHEVRTVERTASTQNTSRSTDTTGGAQPSDSHQSTSSTTQSSSSTTQSSSPTTRGSNPPQTGAETRARFEQIRREQARAGNQDFRKASKIMTLIGAAILVGCVIGTVLGLVFGMPWWASFIIIGSGLVFCLLFVLPLWLIAGRPWAPPGRDPAPRTGSAVAGQHHRVH